MVTINDFKSGLRQERLRELLNYDPKTGVFRWRVRQRRAEEGSIAGCLSFYGYRVIRIDGRLFRAARLAWFYIHGVLPRVEIDHKDLVKDHDWIKNLRPAGQSLNNANRRMYRNNKSGFKGVYMSGGRWRAMIRINNKGYHIGSFDTAEDAHDAYCVRAKEVFGEFANSGE